MDESAVKERLDQFDFCIAKVAAALGVCCGGVDSSPEDQMRDHNSTTRVLLDGIQRLKDQLDQERVQHAGCSVAAMGWISDHNLAKPGDYGWSPAYQDVLDLRRNYEALLKEKDAWMATGVSGIWSRFCSWLGRGR